MRTTKGRAVLVREEDSPLSRDERVIFHEPLSDYECGHTSDI
jgi:hypothetical protein